MLDINELFQDECALLTEAQAIAGDAGQSKEAYRAMLLTMSTHYQRMIRESQRLISRSDRAERELTRVNKQLRVLAVQLEYEATHDALTDTFNRSAIISQITQTLAESHAALILLDIDNFKRINDQYGHPMGDKVICGLIGRIRMCIPDYANVGRIGGEEFTILLPETTLEEAMRVADIIHHSLNHQPLDALPERPVTVSFGVCCAPQHTHFETLYNCADMALYEAKNKGRNQSVSRIIE